MKKVWNVITRSYDLVAEGVVLLGTDMVDFDTFDSRWGLLHTDRQVSKYHLRIIFKCLKAKTPSYGSLKELDDAVKHELGLIYQGYAKNYCGRKGGGGKDTNQLYSGVPGNYKAGLKAIIGGDSTGYYRQGHNSNPSISSGAQSFAEYHLTSTGENGRATSARLSGGLIAYYYSISHAASTYSYHLLTHKYKDPVDGQEYEIPLCGGTFDTLLDGRPF